MIDVIWHSVRDALLMAWQVGWALIAGFVVSGIVQAWVPPERVAASLGSSGGAAVGRATAFGAVSSSCSYAAIAIARSLFAKGASAASALAFQVASTNLVWELGAVLWVLLGWRFAVGEFVGGLVMIALIALALRAFVSRSLEARARRHAEAAVPGEHHCHGPGTRTVTDRAAWTAVAGNVRRDVRMLGREIVIGFALAGVAAQVPPSTWHAVLGGGLPDVVIGPLIAIASFVCSIGNVPLAAVLWAGGISFAGLLAFLLADLLIVPILVIYRRYYGRAFTVRITLLMGATLIAAALIVSGAFTVLGLAPSGPRPAPGHVFGRVRADHTLVLNAIALTGLAALLGLTARRPRAAASERGAPEPA